MGFLVSLLALWIFYLLLMRKVQGPRFRYSSSVLTLTLLSMIVLICLGINYAGASTLIDGSYSINNTIAYWIIGEDSWSPDLFRGYFNISLGTCIVLILLHSILKVIEA